MRSDVYRMAIHRIGRPAEGRALWLGAAPGGGRSEVLWNCGDATSLGQLAPMLITRGASVFAWFREIGDDKEPFAIIVRKARGGGSKILRREGAPPPQTSPSP